MALRDLLDRGVAAGIISPAQADALAALDGGASASPESARREVEAPRGFNGIAVAYGIGAVVVLFAFGWFMVDRWKVLGDAGVFALAFGYAAIFLTVAHVLKREGFHFARGVATLLAVAMAPIAMWALLRWTGLWTPSLDALCSGREHPFAACQGQPMAIEFAAVAAALFAMRQMAFSPFMIPIAVVAVTLPERLLREATTAGQWEAASSGWRWVIIASLLAAAAYTMDKRRRGSEDYAFWLWLAAALASWFGVLMLFQSDAALRPYLGPVALLVITASVILRRRALLVAGLFGLFAYLAWLAFDVFKLTTAFPLVLALIGVSIIILTVWIQKRFPDVIRRIGGDPSRAPSFPGGVVTLLAPALLGLLLLQDAREVDREVRANARSRSHAWASRQRTRRDSIDAARGLRRDPRPPERAPAK